MDKGLVTAGVVIGSIVGSLIPMLWGANIFSFSSIVFSAIGSLLGIYIVYKLTT